MNKIMRNMIRTLYRSKRKVKRSMPTILSVTAVVGVAATTVAAVRATPKALKLLEEAEELKKDRLTKAEVVIAAAPCYIPTAVIAASTIACILGANVLNKRQQASIASAYAMLDRSYKEFRNKVSELYGAEAIRKVETEIAKDNYKDGYAPDENKQLFFDAFRKKYFESTLKDVIEAEQRINRSVAVCGSAYLNEFYDQLGLDRTNEGDVLGWDCCYLIEWQDYCWIDFHHEKVTLDDGLECVIISYTSEPIDIETYWDFGEVLSGESIAQK